MKYLLSVFLLSFLWSCSTLTQSSDDVVVSYLLETSPKKFNVHPFYVDVDGQFLLDSLSKAHQVQIDRGCFRIDEKIDSTDQPLVHSTSISDTVNFRLLISKRCKNIQFATLLDVEKQAVYIKTGNYSYGKSGAIEYLFVFSDENSIEIDTVLSAKIVVETLGKH